MWHCYIVHSKYCALLWPQERSQKLFFPLTPPFTRGVGVNAWRRACLKLGADATVIVTTANHIAFLVLHEWDWLAPALGYLHKAIWLTDACVGAWKVEKFSTSAASNASEATDPQFSSATLDVPPFKVNERRWRRRPVWMGCNWNDAF